MAATIFVMAINHFLLVDQRTLPAIWRSVPPMERYCYVVECPIKDLVFCENLLVQKTIIRIV